MQRVIRWRTADRGGATGRPSSSCFEQVTSPARGRQSRRWGPLERSWKGAERVAKAVGFEEAVGEVLPLERPEPERREECEKSCFLVEKLDSASAPPRVPRALHGRGPANRPRHPAKPSWPLSSTERARPRAAPCAPGKGGVSGPRSLPPGTGDSVPWPPHSKERVPFQAAPGARSRAGVVAPGKRSLLDVFQPSETPGAQLSGAPDKMGLTRQRPRGLERGLFLPRFQGAGLRGPDTPPSRGHTGPGAGPFGQDSV